MGQPEENYENILSSENILSPARSFKVPTSETSDNENDSTSAGSSQPRNIANGKFLRRLAGVTDKEDVLFCSPFRRRRKKNECYLSREEAWEMYLAKLEEEANYFTVSENEAEADICT